MKPILLSSFATSAIVFPPRCLYSCMSFRPSKNLLFNSVLSPSVRSSEPSMFFITSVRFRLSSPMLLKVSAGASVASTSANMLVITSSTLALLPSFSELTSFKVCANTSSTFCEAYSLMSKTAPYFSFILVDTSFSVAISASDFTLVIALFMISSTTKRCTYSLSFTPVIAFTRCTASSIVLSMSIVPSSLRTPTFSDTALPKSALADSLMTLVLSFMSSFALSVARLASAASITLSIVSVSVLPAAVSSIYSFAERIPSAILLM